MSFENAVEEEAPAIKTINDSAGGEKELCRDFKKGDCRRGERCIYHHPKLDVCRDYQFRECTRHDCRFVHVTKAEEEKFEGSGIIPPHVHNGPFKNISHPPPAGSGGYNGILGKRAYSAMSGAPPPPPLPVYGQENSGEICRDFEKGDCRRGARCKFFHPKLVICRDFQKGKCERDNCRFLHMSQDEEKTYDGNGIVPDRIDKEKLQKNRVMAPSSDASGEVYGKRSHDNAYPMAPRYPMSLEAALQENAALKVKLSEMQQQVTDLRRMNDTLYEQNSNYRNQCY